MNKHFLAAVCWAFGATIANAGTIVNCSADGTSVTDLTLCSLTLPYASSSAHATQSQFSLSAFANGSGYAAPPHGPGEASAFASFSDTLVFSGASGAVTMEVQFDVTCGFPMVYGSLGEASLSANGFSEGCSSPAHSGSKTVSIPYSTTLALAGNVQTVTIVGPSGIGGVTTLNLIEIRLLDATHSPISGFNYSTLNAGPYNVSGGTMTPEPGPGFLIGLGLGTLGWMKRRGVTV